MLEARPVSASVLGLPGRSTLYLRGAVPARPRLAVVGSRAASRSLRPAVEHAVEVMRDEGWALVSGGALGIDGDAHRAALAHAVPQVAVLPCGPDERYPPDHRGLFDAIEASGGGLLFASAPASARSRKQFASRNRWVVGLAQAVLVVQAAARSGSTLTGQLALRGGVSLAAVVGSPGCARLIAQGATGLPFDRQAPAHYRGRLREWLARGGAASPSMPSGSGLLQRVRERGALGVTLDDFADPGRAAVELALAEAEGRVVELHPGRWIASGGPDA